MTTVEELAVLLYAELHDDNRTDSEIGLITRLMQAAYDEGRGSSHEAARSV